MKRISQRELSIDSVAILRAVESGEVFVITVDGRPVATLAPYERRRFVGASRVRDLLQAPTDTTALSDTRKVTDHQARGA